MGFAPIHRSRPTGFDLRPASMNEAVEIAPHIWVSEGFSNAFCLPTDAGRLVVNTGMFFEAPVHKRNFEAVDGRPIHTIVLTQGHVDHVGGVESLRAPDTVVIAQQGNAAHQADDDRIAQYRMDKSAFAFGDSVMEGIHTIIDEFGALPPQTIPVPDVTFEDRYDLTLGDRRIELHYVPGGETNDSLVVWLPDEKVALVGNFFSALIGHIPNLVTMRGDRLRDPLAFVASIDRILALEPEVILPGHHGAVEGAELIREELTRIRDATRWVHDRTVAGMNAGRSLWELMSEISLPPELEVGEGYGKVSWDVRAIWELYTGWFKHESTTELYGSPRRSVDTHLVQLAGGADEVASRAAELLVDDDPVGAIHLAEVALSADPDHAAARSTMLAAHRRLRDDESNFWLASWLDKEIARLAAD
jgi:alkyl sulfatase BDS1-like metallo-beta-lactamase superfamily hydrolase